MRYCVLLCLYIHLHTSDEVMLVPESLVGGAGDDVGILEWVGGHVRGDEARDVGHVSEEVRAVHISNLTCK